MTHECDKCGGCAARADHAEGPGFLRHARVAVVGLGQLGGSLALRLRELGCLEVLGLARRQASIDEALERRMIDRGSSTAAEILPYADLTVICLPLSPSLAFVRENVASFRFGGLVTDVGSVKGSIVAGLREPLLARGVYFVGSHPMAGSEKSGLSCARADLYDRRLTFLTPTPEDEPEAVQLLADFWRAVGCQVIELPADRHDSAVAFASHLPHLVAAAASNAILGRGDTEAHELAAAGGFRDFSRIAESNPGMWTDICRHNRQAVLAAIAVFGEELDSLRRAIQAEDLDHLRDRLGQAADARRDWFARHEAPRQDPNAEPAADAP